MTAGQHDRRRLPNRRPNAMVDVTWQGQRLAICIGYDSAGRAAEAGYIEPVLVGEEDAIAALAAAAGWDISAIRTVAAGDEKQAAGIVMAAKCSEVTGNGRRCGRSFNASRPAAQRGVKTRSLHHGR